jgi:hypothetical protein
MPDEVTPSGQIKEPSEAHRALFECVKRARRYCPACGGKLEGDLRVATAWATPGSPAISVRIHCPKCEQAKGSYGLWFGNEVSPEMLDFGIEMLENVACRALIEEAKDGQAVECDT